GSGLQVDHRQVISREQVAVIARVFLGPREREDLASAGIWEKGCGPSQQIEEAICIGNAMRSGEDIHPAGEQRAAAQEAALGGIEDEAGYRVGYPAWRSGIAKVIDVPCRDDVSRACMVKLPSCRVWIRFSA